MKRVFVFSLSVVALSLPNSAGAQISPGELSTAHAHLEGVTHCTQCHALGREVPNDRCLDCHTELRSRIEANSGFHATVREKQCVECHKEHHGRTFALMHFDEKAFDHSSTGFVLEGKHARLACGQCHVREKITDPVVAQNMHGGGHTYLGLSRACTSCHSDVHKGQVSVQCQQCHSFDGWVPVTKFDHARARFRLTGKHIAVPCNKCHRNELDHGTTMKFVGLAFSTCAACHRDPHAGKFQNTCETCHTTAGWNQGIARNFNHATTGFALRGRHATVPCERCHDRSSGRRDSRPGEEFHIARFQHCADCHADVHGGEFAERPGGGACETCHTENGFAPSLFAHTSAEFPLRGKHASVRCEQCHLSYNRRTTLGRTVTFRIPRYQRCSDCHDDAHGGQFVGRPDRGACESCHTEQGYTPSTFSVREHQLSRFLLTGAHEAIPCGACHRPNLVKAKSSRIFQWNDPIRCEACHHDPHNGQFRQTLEKGCVACHSTEGWSQLSFSHDSTRLPLRGKHAGLACSQCHKVTDQGTVRQAMQFAGTPWKCIDCHGESLMTSSGKQKKN